MGLDNTGAIVVEYTYDAWGNSTSTDISGFGLANLNPFRYRGYYYDTETKFYFLKTRYYDPEIGRFISIDGIEYLDPETINGLNLYAYCNNNPVMNIDPNGTWSWKKFWRNIGITAGIVVAAVGAVALTVFTLGTVAPVLATGIIGGIAAFSANVITQGLQNGYGNINWGDTLIQTLSGVAYGVASVLVPGVGGMLAKAGISALTTVVSGVYHDQPLGQIVINAMLSFSASMSVQGLMQTSFARNFFDKLNISHWFARVVGLIL